METTTTPLTAIKKAISLGFSRKNFQNTDLLAETCFYLEKLAESGSIPSTTIEGDGEIRGHNYTISASDYQSEFEYEESGSGIDEVNLGSNIKYVANPETGDVFKIIVQWR